MPQPPSSADPIAIAEAPLPPLHAPPSTDPTACRRGSASGRSNLHTDPPTAVLSPEQREAPPPPPPHRLCLALASGSGNWGGGTGDRVEGVVDRSPPMSPRLGDAGVVQLWHYVYAWYEKHRLRKCLAHFEEQTSQQSQYKEVYDTMYMTIGHSSLPRTMK